MKNKLLVFGFAVLLMFSLVATISAAPQVPTLISYQGKLANQTTGDPFTTVSIRINVTNRSNFDQVVWNNTFNDATDSNGVFKLVLGRVKTLYLTPGKDYNIIAMVDLGSATYTSPDLIFGDISPSGDEIIFNAGGPSDATELVMSDNSTSVEEKINTLETAVASNESNWNLSGGRLYPTVLSSNVSIGTTNAVAPLTVKDSAFFNFSNSNLIIGEIALGSHYYPGFTPYDSSNSAVLGISGTPIIFSTSPAIAFEDSDTNNLTVLFFDDGSFEIAPWLFFQKNIINDYTFKVSSSPSSASPMLFFNNSDFVVNEGSQDTNFRVESNNNDHAFFVDGSSGNVSIAANLTVGQGISLGGEYRTTWPYSTSGTLNSTAWNRTGTNVILANTPDFVGIGTESPTHKLTVVGDANITGTVYAHNYSGNSDIVFFNRSGKEIVRFTDDGRVGISTSSPASQLEISHDNSSMLERGLTVSQHSNSVTSALLWFAKSRGTSSIPAIVESSDNIGSIWARPYNGSEYVPTAGIGFHVNGTVAGNNIPTHIVFSLNPSGNETSVTDSEKMRITSEGYLGINTSTPSHLLNVLGDANITGNLYTGALVNQGDLTVLGDLNVTGASYLNDVIVDADYIRVNNIYSRDGNVTINNTLRVTHDGKVGIGTLNPTHDLTVVGDINTTGDMYVTDNLYVGDNTSTNTWIDMTTQNQAAGIRLFNRDGALWAINKISGSDNFNIYNYELTSRALVIESATNDIGIGIANPTEKLSVDGTMQVSSVTPEHEGSIVNGTDGALLEDPYSVYVSGKYAYVINDGPISAYGSLEIIDISNPSNPSHVGSLRTGHSGLLYGAKSVYVSGKYAYVTSTNSDTFEIIDVSDPSSPTHVGSLGDGDGGALLNNPESVYVSGKYAYIASVGSGALEIIDVSDPANPVHAGNLSDGVDGAQLSFPSSVYVSGEYAYVASRGSNALEIVDVSDPSNPAHAGSIAHGAGGAELNGPESVYVSGKYAYVVSLSSDSLEIVDVSDPSNPTHTGSLSNGGSVLLEDPQSVYVSGKYAYIVSLASDALEVVDVSDPSSPAHEASLTHDAGGALLDGPSSVYVSGKYAYVSNLDNNSLEIVDISGLDAPSASIGTIATSTLEVSENADIKNDLSIGNGLVVGGSVNINGELAVKNDTYIGGNLTAAQGITLGGDYRTSWPTAYPGSANSTSWNRTGTDVILANTPDNVGIGTESPSDKLSVIGNASVSDKITVGDSVSATALHVTEGAVLFNGTFGGPGVTPAAGTGVRLMWIPAKASFREGSVAGNEWDDANIGNYSFSIGENTVASGKYSSSFGYNASATGDYSYAAGSVVNASGLGAIAFGIYSSALSQGTLSMGIGPIASGNYSSVFGGWNNTASGEGSATLGGFQNTAAGEYSTALGGRRNTAQGNYSFAMGRRSKALQNGTFALSDSQKADFNVNTIDRFGARFAGGYWLTGGPVNITDDLYVMGSSYLGDIVISTDSITVNNIYSKDGNLTLNNSVRITPDGNVGIGTLKPDQKLKVEGSVNVTQSLYTGDSIYVNGTLAIENNGTHICFGGC